MTVATRPTVVPPVNVFEPITGSWPSPPAHPAHDTERLQADSELAKRLGPHPFDHPRVGPASLLNIPPKATLGLWLNQLDKALRTPDFRRWMKVNNISPDNVQLHPDRKGVDVIIQGKPKAFYLGDNSGFAEVAGPLLQAVETLGFWPPSSGHFLHYPSKPYHVASAAQVLQFYGVRQDDPHAVAQMVSQQRFPDIPSTDELRGDAALAEHQRALDDSTRWFAAPIVLPATRERDDYTRRLHALHKALPSVRDEAKQWAETMIFKLTGLRVDADTLYLNRFEQAQSANTVTGWEHLAEEPTLSQKLPDALLSNFNEHDWLPGALDQQAGLYTAGPGQRTKGGYGAHNQFALAPSRLMHDSWKTDFQGRITQKLESFWRDHGDDYRTLLKGEFVYQARQQLKAYERASPAEREKMPASQRFTEQDYRLVMAAANVPLDVNQPLTVKQLQACSAAKGVVHAHAFDINGYLSNDILRFSAVDGPHSQLRDRRDGVQILYVPGHQPAFLRFDSLSGMDQWVAEQGREPQKRKALESHFSLRDRQDNDVGFWSDVKAFITGDSQSGKGVDTAVKYLGSGYWDKIEGTVIDSTNVAIHGDVFSAVRDATRKRMTSDADVLIKSNSETTRDTWLNDVTTAAGLLSKFALTGEPIVIAAAGAAGLAEAALGTEKALTGDTQAERQQGTSAALDGVLNILFSMGGGATTQGPLKWPAKIPLRRETFADGQQALVADHPLPATAYTLRRTDGYDLVAKDKVYRYRDSKPGELTNLESMDHTRPLENVEPLCPAPSVGGRVRRGVNDDCFVKIIEDLPASQAPLQAMEHVRLFPSKAGLFNKERTVVYQKRLHKRLDTETGPQLVPVADGKRILYKQQVRGRIIIEPGFGFRSADSAGVLAKETRVVKLNSISAVSDDQRQVRSVVVTSGDRQYLVLEADTAEFYYAPLNKVQSGDITFNKCGPFQLSLVQGYRKFLNAHPGANALDADFIVLPSLQEAYAQLKRSGWRKADVNELKALCKGMSNEQQREVAYQLQRANAIVQPDVALRARRVAALETPADFTQWPTKQKNQFYAQQAKAHVNQALKASGLGPGNPLRSAADLARSDAAAMTVGWLRRTASLGAPNADDMIIKTGAGNCGEMALLSRDIVNKSGGIATEWHAGDVHSFTVVGGPTGPVRPTVDFSEPDWADAWVIDPWADIACPARDYTQQLQATMTQWDRLGWKIRAGKKPDMSPLEPDWMDALVKQPKRPYALQQADEQPLPIPSRLPLKTANKVHVDMGESKTLNKGGEVLATRGLTDCSAIAVLTDWNGTTYQKRTLMHLTGSNLELGLRGGNTQALLDSLQASLNNGGKVILVGGVNSDSIQGLATTLGQTFNGRQPLRDLFRERPGVTLTLAGSLGITINADGTFELIEDTGKGVLPADKVRQVFERVD
ncbi:dermonecrotic toxin domain-containing protein [Pseudomonas sp. S1_E04]